MLYSEEALQYYLFFFCDPTLLIMLHLLPLKILIVLRLGSYYLFFYDLTLLIMLHLLPCSLHCPLHSITPAQPFKFFKSPTPSTIFYNVTSPPSLFHNHGYAPNNHFSRTTILAPGFCDRSADTKIYSISRYPPICIKDFKYTLLTNIHH